MQKEDHITTGSFVPVLQKALGDEKAFAKLVSPDVTLEETIFVAPIDGREKVWAAVRTAGRITDSLRFTHESSAADRRHLEWGLEALGHRLNGVSVISFDGSGLIDRVAFYQRPLAGVLAFSAEMGRRLGNSVGPDMFFPATTGG